MADPRGNDGSSAHERGGAANGRPADVPNWHNKLPSGLKDGVDEEEAAKIASRPRAEQRVHEQDRRLRKFTETQFVAHVTDKVTYNRNGDMMVTIQVPYQFKHLAEPLTDAFGIPLSFDVQVWRPYTEATG